MNVRAVVLPLAVAGVAAAIWLSNRTETAAWVPSGTWRIGTGTDIKQARNYDVLAPESPLRLSYSCKEPRHVYVFSHSIEDGTLLLFPSPIMKSDLANPLPAGKAVLPGKHQDKELAWTTRTEILATTTYIVVAAREPVTELEALLPHLRRWTNSVLPDGSMQVTNPDLGTEVAGKPRSPLPSELLIRAAERSLNETVINGPLHEDAQLPDVWTSSWRAKEERTAPAPPPDKK